MVGLNNKYSQAEIDEYKKQKRRFYIIRAARLKRQQHEQTGNVPQQLRQPDNGFPQQQNPQSGGKGPQNRHPKNNQPQQPQPSGNDGPGKRPTKKVPPKNDSFVYEDDAEMKVKGLKNDKTPIRWEKWNDMDLNKQLLANIKECGYIRPRRVQEVVIPYITEGYNIKCQSETGTGKTAAYLIPIIDNLIKENAINGLPTDGPICLIIAPTRELVSQIYCEAKRLTRNTKLKVVKACGGTRTFINQRQLDKGCHILCACLGRLFSLMKEWYLYLNYLKYIVIDEADQFLIGRETQPMISFFEDEMLPPIEDRQTLFFSPTLQIEHLKLADKFSDSKNRIIIESNSLSNQRITYLVESIPAGTNTFEFLNNYIKEIMNKHNGECPRIIIFANTIKMANAVFENLISEGFQATVNHSDFSQPARNKALYDFKVGEDDARILVSIKICGRGIDIHEMNYVINFEYPESKWQFIQRCGRTGRVQNGTAITFCVEPIPWDIGCSIREVIEAAGQEVPNFLPRRTSATTTGLEASMGQFGIKGHK